jgi:starvation-inducible DNA-binding protein
MANLQTHEVSEHKLQTPTDKTEVNAMHRTKNDLSESTRVALVKILNARLADAIDLMHQAKQAHWNVRGASFIALHKLFDEIVDSAEEYMDLVAERVVQLGGTSLGTIRIAARNSSLKEYPTEISDQRDHVDALSSALAAFGKSVRHAIDEADELHDRDTADIFTEISRGVDKYLWFVEAHLG